jgi:hypothetical protein
MRNSFKRGAKFISNSLDKASLGYFLGHLKLIDTNKYSVRILQIRDFISLIRGEFK